MIYSPCFFKKFFSNLLRAVNQLIIHWNRKQKMNLLKTTANHEQLLNHSVTTTTTTTTTNSRMANVCKQNRLPPYNQKSLTRAEKLGTLAKSRSASSFYKPLTCVKCDRNRNSRTIRRLKNFVIPTALPEVLLPPPWGPVAPLPGLSACLLMELIDWRSLTLCHKVNRLARPSSGRTSYRTIITSDPKNQLFYSRGTIPN